ncbi:MAG: hypothetical protein MJ225_00765 [Bacilli bacterium]|nr:hypothetical protein [Bacilli bacterium]
MEEQNLNLDEVKAKRKEVAKRRMFWLILTVDALLLIYLIIEIILLAS